jgi:hypothetical protein
MLSRFLITFILLPVLTGTTLCKGITESNNKDLDFREANVTGATYEPQDNGHTFSVTLYHDDDGEDGYANWWQVETLDGKYLGRRALLHAHGTREFTRSGQITVPADVKYVVIRGHDQTHGYGGQAIILNLETGDQDKIKQGSNPMDFSGYQKNG